MISVRDLNFKYMENGFSLKNISIDILKGDFIAFVGPNGAGKSTFVRILAGIINNYSGDAIVAGKNLRQYKSIEFAKKVSYIPQTDSHVFNFTVYDIVAMGRRPYTGSMGLLKKTDREAIDAALNDYGLYEKKDKFFNQLSGGERRTALIAKAIAQESDILLMDEPTTYLDIHHQIFLMEKLLGLKDKSGKTIFFISHNINLASEYAGRVIFIKDGTIVKDGKPKEVITSENIEKIYGINNFTVEANKKTGAPNLFVVPGKTG
jgi:iron complex transport system ATP-binding protein